MPGSVDPFTTSRAAAQTSPETIINKDIPKEEINPLVRISVGAGPGAKLSLCVCEHAVTREVLA